jgi:DNA-binding transcriptional ArsR family regulator
MRVVNQLFEALAHPTRREILELLKRRSMTAGEIAERFDVSKPTLSGHFAKLRDAGLIQADRNGTSITYSLNMSVLEEVLLGFMGRMGLTPEQKDAEQ